MYLRSPSFLFLLTLVTLLACNYRERYLIQLKEKSMPCMGVSRLRIEITDPENNIDPVSQEYVKDAFWTEDGRCDLPDGLVIKGIPFGGERTVNIIGYDSADQKVAQGQSLPFLVESLGDDLPDTISLEFKRRDGVGLGTLSLKFLLEDRPPLTTRLLVLILHKHTDPIPDEDRQYKVTVQDINNLSNILTFTNVPQAKERPYTLRAIDKLGITVKEWKGIYTINNTTDPLLSVALLTLGT